MERFTASGPCNTGTSQEHDLVPPREQRALKKRSGVRALEWDPLVLHRVHGAIGVRHVHDDPVGMSRAREEDRGPDLRV